MKILQINTTVNSGSTGRIMEDIGSVLQKNGHESYVAFGRANQNSKSKTIKIGNTTDVLIHYFITAVSDRHGLASTNATKKLIDEIEKIAPDAIGLHNLHGYYINIELLFNYLKKKNIPVLWTLFDCWAFTGHCSYFDSINCEKWKTACSKCPKKRFYPSAYFIDNSKNNFVTKNQLFTSLDNLNIVVHSDWLAKLVSESFLKQIPTIKIASGIDLNLFKPTNNNIREKLGLENKKIILGCASKWDTRKGLDDFVKLSNLIPSDYRIILIGLNSKQIAANKSRFICINRTENVNQLAEFYSMADVFVNPTYQDNFPTTNLEALACGTPVITYNTGGSPEAIDIKTGIVIEKGDINGLLNAIKIITTNGKNSYSLDCRKRAEKLYNKNDRYQDYLSIFEKITNYRK